MESLESKNAIKIKGTCSHCGSLNVFAADAESKSNRSSIYIIDPGQHIQAPDQPCRTCHRSNGTYTTIGQVVRFWRGEVMSIDDADSVWIVRFKEIIIESQTTGQSGSHTIGKILFDVTDGSKARNTTEEIPGIAKDFECVIRHAAGPGPLFEDAGLEVEVPVGLKKLVKFSEFQEACDEYYYGALEDGSFIGAVAEGSINSSIVRNSRLISGGMTTVKKSNKKVKGAW
ncbi:hypothetical protein KB206_10625 [Microvirga sp. STS02]|uniref:hypothetical protein n=1 Tax=Hymenobacter negativus TaxID=2795026 RepID=UPI0018DD715A|nr:MULTISPECIES: hypothetical protein [Bacteria]MBH8569340.1 hypothetical protein [Hymenobacter negativus]MBR7209074.1 hypothetical protein [Microvirga sp. STS02]